MNSMDLPLRAEYELALPVLGPASVAQALPWRTRLWQQAGLRRGPSGCNGTVRVGLWQARVGFRRWN